jgi:hypothetical protein
MFSCNARTVGRRWWGRVQPVYSCGLPAAQAEFTCSQLQDSTTAAATGQALFASGRGESGFFALARLYLVFPLAGQVTAVNPPQKPIQANRRAGKGGCQLNERPGASQRCKPIPWAEFGGASEGGTALPPDTNL